MEIFFNTFQVKSNDAKNVLVLAATKTPYDVATVRKKYHPSNKLRPCIEKIL